MGLIERNCKNNVKQTIVLHVSIQLDYDLDNLGFDILVVNSDCVQCKIVLHRLEHCFLVAHRTH